MALEHISTKIQAKNMRVNGRMIKCMVKVLKPTQMVQATMACLNLDKNKEREPSSGLMELIMKVIGRKISSKDMVVNNGEMVENILESGKITK